MLSIPPPGERDRAGSLPPSMRRSADHGRALKAADKFGLRLAKKLVQRPLMSVWDAVQSDEKHVTLTVVDACATEGERTRILGAASSLIVLAGTTGVQDVHSVAEAVEAFVSNPCANGTAADLVVLRWPLRERLSFVARVCDALEGIHGAGLVHGGLCPDNVLLDDELAPVLSEIGMVSLSDSLEGDREGFFGYGAYASPEAQDGAALDARSDVLSVGHLLAFLVTEHEPNDASERELTGKAAGLGTVYRKAVSALPEQRHESVAELRADLDRIRTDLTVTMPGPARPHAAAPRPAAPAAPKPSRTSGYQSDVPIDAAVIGARPKAGVIGILLAIGAMLPGYLLPLEAAGVFGLTLVVAAGLATATLMVPMSSMRWRSISVLGVLLVSVALDPVGRVGAAGAWRRLHRSTPAGREAVVAILRNGERDLAGANLVGADLSRLDLGWANLAGADLSSADLSRTLLINAKLDDANMTGAVLDRVDMSGTDLSSVRGIETAKCERSTMLPAGWDCYDGKPGKQRTDEPPAPPPPGAQGITITPGPAPAPPAPPPPAPGP